MALWDEVILHLDKRSIKPTSLDKHVPFAFADECMRYKLEFDDMLQPEQILAQYAYWSDIMRIELSLTRRGLDTRVAKLLEWLDTRCDVPKLKRCSEVAQHTAEDDKRKYTKVRAQVDSSVIANFTERAKDDVDDDDGRTRDVDDVFLKGCAMRERTTGELTNDVDEDDDITEDDIIGMYARNLQPKSRVITPRVRRRRGHRRAGPIEREADRGGRHDAHARR